MKSTLLRMFRSLAAIMMLSACWTQAHAAELPMVQNVKLNGDQLTWDAVDNATGYNIYLGSSYLTTVKGNRVFTVTEVGTYWVVAFDDNGNFSPFMFTEDNSPFFESGVDNRPLVNEVSGSSGYFSARCLDLAAGETCTARCPDFVGDDIGGGFFVGASTGGACNSSGTDFVNSRISPDEYSCTVSSFTARVEAQVVCAVTPNN
ncbi:MAG: hypothetical protein KTR32_23485 [Granulosicoccus sp.]|nr:hypothetical protein [Granulosicoccus sp.]